MSRIQSPFPFTDFKSRDRDGDRVLSLVDLRMLELSHALRSKPSWWTKIHDPTIRSRWKPEALEHEIRGGKMKEAEVEWVLYYGKMRDETSGMQPSWHVRIWESDELVSEDLNSKLNAAVAVLENVPEEEKDWHPRSNDQVLDLLGENCSPVKALGYINNVDQQKHKDLIPTIECLVGRFSLFWDKVLTDILPKHDFRDLGRTKVSGLYEWIYDPDYPLPRWEERQELGKDGWNGRSNPCDAHKSIKLPTVDERGYRGSGRDITSREVTSSMQGKKAQVIIKIANIHLRRPSNQVVGAVKTFANRCIAFPNIYQHQVSSFKLADPTKPGHRKIVALFLVDPENRIPSTSDIAPQQSHWVSESIFPALAKDSHRMKTPLPVELVDMVADQVDNVMTLEEAKAYRLELMDERTAFVDVVD
ncbi:hypothetical protein FS837_003028 [Tulasnella sp. UAMH 9824]|nr:hypothetical protein FS837_003028 [Tulasnella sp. UAMH 9824]